MNLSFGIVGLPNIGKSTLFNALTRSSIAESANYPFCTIEPNIGQVSMIDDRLHKIASIVSSQNIIMVQLLAVDIAGLIKGANQGEGLGNKFLHNIREVDVIVHVLRCFSNEEISHVHNVINPVLDAEIVNMELILADINTLEKKLFHLKKHVRDNNQEQNSQIDLIYEILVILQSGKPARLFKKHDITGLQLLTTKPMIYICNVEDTYMINGNVLSKSVMYMAQQHNSQVCCISVKLEDEISRLETSEEQKHFLSEFGLEESALNKMTRILYDIMGMITCFTVGPKEARAWPVKRGSKADQVAGLIHTDFKTGFIKAETISLIDFIQYRGQAACKQAGKVRLEGRDYIVQDGDIMHFRFNI
ncbi:redox-regulated ATPase YchF [Wolbachia endosymbiont of Howardula sp.]|uniref:redox-regulated ATPase YchF n=1 Tax=Wolbachia endosymbiont of Howardula sp. TaxID=2916816 RepID=UPI00217E2CA7|nr:redox-regulated ATPase YchF [Wolbachia endosymbiont of Howardula sp.]UWI83377.1 redox-regulated ATPase YchF [Wolbachia endosymbiont of Howardula sp.]